VTMHALLPLLSTHRDSLWGKGSAPHSKLLLTAAVVPDAAPDMTLVRTFDHATETATVVSRCVCI
jgi:hypothetical protein